MRRLLWSCSALIRFRVVTPNIKLTYQPAGQAISFVLLENLRELLWLLQIEKSRIGVGWWFVVRRSHISEEAPPE